MAKQEDGQDGSSLTVIRTYKWAEKNGIKVTPLTKGAKAAIDQNYADPSYQSPPLDRWIKNDLGIGVITGPVNSGPVDIDLDCAEAIHFAPYFLPPTQAVFGRKSKPRSHYLYRVDTPTFDKFAIVDRAKAAASVTTIVEARGERHQTAAPGTINPSGEIVEWAHDPMPELTTVPAQELVRSVQKIALATLVARYVWGAGNHNAPTLYLTGTFFYLKWSQEEVEQFITALMEWDGDKDTGARIGTVRNTYKKGEQGKKIQGAGVLRKQLKDDDLTDRILELAGNPTINLLNEYNERYACVTLGSQFRIAKTDVTPGDDIQFFSADNWKLITATDYMQGTTKPVTKGSVWLASPTRRTYSKVDFLPGQEDTTPVLNLWTGWAVQPCDGDCSAWLDLVRNVLCGGSDELSTWMLNWLANIVLEPMKKSRTSLVLSSHEQGIGKTLAINYFGKILGEGSGYVSVANGEQITGKFNSHLSRALLLHSEEAIFAGDKKHASIIKSLITDSTRTWEPKNVDPITVKNYVRLVSTSNDDRAAAAQMKDRRYTMIDASGAVLSKSLQDAVVKEFETTGPAALLKYLTQEFKYDPEIPQTTIKTQALFDTQMQNSDPVDAWWLDVLREGVLVPEELKDMTKPQDDDWPAVVASKVLHYSAVLNLRAQGVRRLPVREEFAKRLNRMVGVKLERKPVRFVLEDVIERPRDFKEWGFGDRQLAITNMPSLEDCRTAFEEYSGSKVEWPDPDDTTPRFMKSITNFDKTQGLK
jgi:hypothetical protein